MFSLLDTILDQEKENVIEELPLKDELKSALIDQGSDLGDFLKIALAHERADGETLDILSEKHGVAINKYPELYVEASEWADTFTI